MANPTGSDAPSPSHTTCGRCNERAVDNNQVVCALCAAAEELANQKFNRMLLSPLFLVYALCTAIAFALLGTQSSFGHSLLFLSLAIPLPIGLMILAAIKK